MPIVLLIRHGQASFGTADYDLLSERGHAQVGALHRALARRGVVADRVVTGSLRRQRDTGDRWAEAAAGAIVDQRWDEYDDDDVLSHHSSTRTRLARAPADTDPAMSSRDFQVVLDSALQEWVDAGSDELRPGRPGRSSSPGSPARSTTLAAACAAARPGSPSPRAG